MTRGRRILIISVLVLGALFLAAATVVPRLIDLDRYHDRAVRETEAALGRPVRLGEMRLSLLPPVGVRIRDVAIGGSRAGDPDLLTMGEASVRLKVLPLLFRREVAIGTITFDEPSISLRRLEDGRWDLPVIGKERPAEPPAAVEPPGAPAAAPAVAGIAIDRLRISGGKIRFTDEAAPAGSPAHAEIDGIDLIASLEARSGKINASARGSVERLSLDIPAKAAARAAKRAPVECEVDFDLEVAGAGERVTVNTLRFTFPESRLSVNGSLEKRAGGLWVDLSVPESKIMAQDIRALTPALNLEFPPGLTAAEPIVLQGKVSGPVARPQDLQVSGALGLRGVRFETAALGKPVENVGARVEFSRDSVSIGDLTASLGATRLSGSLGVESFSAPRVSFDLRSDKADLGELFALLRPAPAGAAAPVRAGTPGEKTPAAGPAKAAAAPSAGGTPPHPLIEKTRGRGTLRIKEGAFGSFDFSDFEGTVAMDGLRLDFDPLAFKLYGGSYRGAATADLKGKEPRYTYRMRLEGVNADPMLTDNLKMPDLLGGAITADLELAGSGRDYDTIVKALAGSGSIRVADGFVGSLNVMEGIANAADLFGETTLKNLGRSLSQEKTSFRELSGDVSIGGGRVTSRNLTLLSENLDLRGKGAFTLDGKLDFDLKAIFSEALSRALEQEGSKARYLGREGDRYALPLTITGTLLAPSFGLDVREVARSAARQKVEDSLLEKIGADREGLRRLLGKEPAPERGGSPAPGLAASSPPAAAAAPGTAPAPSAGSAASGAPPLAVRITEARLGGNFLKPDLRVKGVLSGVGIERAALIVKSREGKVLHEEKTVPEIDTYYSTHDRAAQAEIAFSRKVEGLIFPGGGVQVTVVLQGSGGTRVEQTATADR